jgi:hypothetical protein
MVAKESTVAFAASVAFTMKFCKCIDFAAKMRLTATVAVHALDTLGDVTQTEQILLVLVTMVVKESTDSIAATLAFTMKLCKCIDFAAKTAGENKSVCTCLDYLG